MILGTALICLAANIYFEARGEDLTGQHAVAQVTMNRAGRDPKKVCEVVLAPHQFSWANGKLRRHKGQVLLAKADEPKDQKAWEFSKNVAMVTLNGWTPDFTNGATHYHTVNVRPIWRYDLKFIARIGRHRFYA